MASSDAPSSSPSPSPSSQSTRVLSVPPLDGGVTGARGALGPFPTSSGGDAGDDVVSEGRVEEGDEEGGGEKERARGGEEERVGEKEREDEEACPEGAGGIRAGGEGRVEKVEEEGEEGSISPAGGMRFVAKEANISSKSSSPWYVGTGGAL